ncbi:MAG: DUF512 domain-containing protein [Truepera sp.]|jgi:putative radical SAM enzyme (TIGR03279 family)|nr:DUF512 domain-containing protein [Truepera sp.]
MPRVILSRKDPRPVEITPARVRGVAAGSPAAVAGVREGWELHKVNGKPIPDILAYRRELEGGDAALELREPTSGKEAVFRVGWEEPGLEFDDVIFDGIRLCANHCDFCYIHQMPKGMRKSLYIMDDDFRTSFLYGSFVTLTNLREEDVRRILDENLSPLYVSVHTANEQKRAELMNWWPNKVPLEEAVSVRGMIERLESIELYTQMVLLPGRNDGDDLDETLSYLASRPNVLAAATVPVGLTGHRGHLTDLAPYTPEQAADVIERVQRFQERMLAERGTRFVFASDEFYIRAGLPLPEDEAYEGYAMLENGVGMVRDFLARGMAVEPPERLERPRRVLLATGRLFAPVLSEALAPLASVEGLELEVRAITNRTFGEVTTVAGLLAGRDIIAGVQKGEADLLLLSPNMFKYGTETMLDDRTRSEVQDELGMRVAIGGTNLAELVETILTGEVHDHLPSIGFSTHAIKEAAKQH